MSITTIRPLTTEMTLTSETEKETIMTDTTTTTITLTASQLERLTYLAQTTITGKVKETGGKSLEEVTYQAIERGIASIEQTRKQYARTREALKAYKS